MNVVKSGLEAGGLDASLASPESPHRSLDNDLTRLQESFKTKDLDFTSLRGLKVDDVMRPRPDESPLLPTLRQLCLLTKITMLHMNQSCPGLPPDSLEKTLELVTQPGAKVVVLTGILPGETSEPQILGYGIMMKGRDNIIDKYHIPAPLLESENACRVIRLFVTTEAREFLPRGEAFTKIIDRIKFLAEDGLLIGMILTDIKSKTGQTLNPSVWLDANLALDARGFTRTGYGLTEHFDSIEIPFEWWTWSNDSKPTASQQALGRKISDLEYYKQERLAPLVPAIPLSSAIVAVHGRPTHSFDIAQSYPGNLVIAPSYEDSRRPESAHNLIRIRTDETESYIDPDKLDTSVVMGAMPDIINQHGDTEPKDAIRLFIEAQYRQLKTEGSLVIRDSIAPEHDPLIQVRLDERTSEQWRLFIEKREEKHITQESWDSVREMSVPAGQPATWITPLVLAMEFMNKFDKQESNRLYTVLTAKERRGQLEDTGFIISYDAPVVSRSYERRTFQGKIELFDLNGAKLDYPSLSQVTIAEKVSPSDVARIGILSDTPLNDTRFLKVLRFEKLAADGKIESLHEIVSRQKASSGNLVTLDVLPYFVREKFGTRRLYFGGRIVPRPLIALNEDDPSDQSYNNIFHVEQVGAIFDQKQLSSGAEISARSGEVLEARAGIRPSNIKSYLAPSSGYTRPDAIDERIVMQGVRTDDAYWTGKIDNRIYDLEVRPKISTFEASRFLQGCQAGIFQDRRLELMIYHIAPLEQVELQRWLGEPLALKEQPDFKVIPIRDLSAKLGQAKSDFRESDIPRPGEFFETRQVVFVEHDKDGRQKGEARLECIGLAAEQKLRNHSISVLPVSKKGNEIFVGLEARDFVAAYIHTGQARLLTVPTLRIPKNINAFPDACRWTSRRLDEYFHISTNELQKLGGEYLTSPGCTSETIQPVICEVIQKDSPHNNLQWVSLKELLAQAENIECLQLRTAVYRAAHMYGELGELGTLPDSLVKSGSVP